MDINICLEGNVCLCTKTQTYVLQSLLGNIDVRSD
jgi:hypothetical protein